ATAPSPAAATAAASPPTVVANAADEQKNAAIQRQADEIEQQQSQTAAGQGLTLLGIPIHIEMLGLFDTVASVGLSPALPFVSGHFSWADQTMPLEKAGMAGFVKNGYHFVAAHEQRKSFSVDSICIKGGYPKGNFQELLYPGVHSDVGGGYPPGEQYRALDGMGHVLSQIALHDMYAKCWQHGMPLQVHAEHPDLAAELAKVLASNSRFKLQHYEKMNRNVAEEFDVQLPLVQRFNQWLASLSAGDLPKTIEAQTHHITAWRIYRWLSRDIAGYADHLGVMGTGDLDTRDLKEKKEQVQAREALIRRKRQALNDAYLGKAPAQLTAEAAQLAQEEEAALLKQAGLADIEHSDELLNAVANKNYVPGNDGWDLLEAAMEFKADYFQQFRIESFMSVGQILNVAIGGSMYMLNNDNEAEEFKSIYDEGNTLYYGNGAESGGGASNGSSNSLSAAAAVALPAGPVAKGEDRADAGEDTADTAGGKEGQAESEGKEDTAKIRDMFRQADKLALSSGTVLAMLRAQQAGTRGTELMKVGLDAALERLKKGNDSQAAQAALKLKKVPGGYPTQHAKLVELFDEQIHDSRAWFMHQSAIMSREPFTDYFRYRLVFSGRVSNKPLSPIMIADRIVGLAGISRSAYLSIKYRNPAYLLMGLNNPTLFVGEPAIQALYTAAGDYERILIDPETGRIAPTTDNAKALWAFTENMQKAVEEMKNDLANTDPWSREDFQNRLADQIRPHLNETSRNLEQIIRLLNQRSDEAQEIGDMEQYTADKRLLKQISEQHDMIETDLAQSDGISPAVPTDIAGNGGADSGAPAMLGLPSIASGLPVGSIATGLADTNAAAAPLAEITPQSTADYLRAELMRYQNSLQQNGDNAVALLHNGVGDPQQLGSVFYNNAAGDITEQSIERISMAALKDLGLDIEANEYILENLSDKSQDGIIRLTQDLRSGRVPDELRSLPADKLELMRTTLEKWIG
ncbi:DUF2235 domain-containing protein, partial [Testudinibacter sp. TR-2022]